MQLAAAAAEMQACAQVQAQTQAQVAQLMHWMECSRHNRAETEIAQDAAAAQQHCLPTGMTLRLAARGISPLSTALPDGHVNPPSKQMSKTVQPSQKAMVGVASLHQPLVKNKVSPQEGGGHKKTRETLRTYLQELRGEDPRCVFITRRINKLGFRSKSLLERHYMQYGEVAQVLVAHSKVKPFPNSGTLPRTRPGNFGLVVMKSADAVRNILAEGSEQVVAGVEIQVHMFEHLRMEKDLEDEDDEQNAMNQSAAQEHCAASIRASRCGSLKFDEGNDSLASGSVGSASGDAVHFENLQDDDDSNQQGTSSSAGSEKDGSVDNRTGTTMSVTDWRRSRSTSASCSNSNGSHEKASNGSDRSSQASSSRRHVAAGHVGADRIGQPQEALDEQQQKQHQQQHPPEDNVHLGQLDMQELEEWARSYMANLSTTPSVSMNSNLAVVLGELSRIATHFDHMNSFTREQSIQAAALAQWAQHSLKRLEEECQQKIAELSHVRPAPGLDVASLPSTAMPSAHVPFPAWSTSQAFLGPSNVPAARLQPPPKQAPLATMSLAQTGESNTPIQSDSLGVAALASSSHHQITPPATTVSKSVAVVADSGEASSGNNAVVQKAAPRRTRARSPENGSGQRDTLRSHLTELSTEDPGCIFITRRINKLGFRSREILQQHYSQYGEVSRVLVAHSKVKPFRDSSGQLRTRPGGLGLVVMRKALAVNKILALGEEQMVAGHQIRIQCFERPKVDETSFNGSETSTTVGKSQGTGSDGSGSRSNGKSEEGGSSNDPYEKSDADAGSSGAESPEGGSSGDALPTR
jgi:hypothetical protein